MNNDYQNPGFKKLLKKLQEESWQLELIISGFAIFGLFTAFEPLSEALETAQFKGQFYATLILTIVFISCAILIFNLLLHVILRGLWIGTLGLRYVSGDIDYESLKYDEKFTRYLKKKVGSFDKYIATLENYCSVIFAISFLLIFYVLAVTFTILTIAMIGNLIINNENFAKTPRMVIGVTLLFIVVIGMVFTFIDFMTQGWLKKKKWTSKIYFPIYWVFSIITVSFLYRPLVYNFLDNKFGKRLSFLLLPIYIGIFVLVTLEYKNSNYITSADQSSNQVANAGNYLDLLTDKTDFIDEAAISSKVITTPYLNVFMLFNDNIEDNVFNYNSGLKPNDDVRGLGSDIVMFSNIDWNTKDSLKTAYIKTVNDIYSIRIDSTDYESEFILTENKFKDLGFESYIGMKQLEEGKHLFQILRKRIKNGDTLSHFIAKIPFWYYKN